MKNLQERTAAMSNLHKQAVQLRDTLVDCMNTVEILRRRADELVNDAAVESEQTGDVRQAVEWLNRGEFVRRKAWQTNDGSPMRLALPIGGNHLYLQVGQGPRRDCAEWIPGTADLLATDWMVCKE